MLVTATNTSAGLFANYMNHDGSRLASVALNDRAVVVVVVCGVLLTAENTATNVSTTSSGGQCDVATAAAPDDG